MGDFDVFDEWGNWVGKFTPAGAGAGYGCLLLVALILVGVIGFFVYLLIKVMIILITEGYQAAKKKEWGKVLVCFGVIALPFVLFFVLLSSTVAVSVAQQHEQELKEKRVQQEIRELEANPPITVNVWKGACTSRQSSDCPLGDKVTHIFIEVTNDWRGEVGGKIDATREGGKSISPAWVSCNNSLVLLPRETRKLTCGAPALWGGSEVVNSIERVCITFFFKVSSDDPMFQHEPRPVICRDVK